MKERNIHMKLSLLSQAICRTPIFSIEDDLKSVWNDLKIYIEGSSPEFYNTIKDYDYGSICNLSNKEQYTIWKYYNRARYRATPFGSFAAFSTVPVGYDSRSNSLTISQRPLSHYFKNWKVKEQLDLSPNFLVANAGYFRTNNTCYLNGRMIRFLSSNNDQFELSAIQYSDIIFKTLEFCKLKREPETLTQFLAAEYQIKKSLALFFVRELLEQQLLVTDLHPNIIGQDYFGRIHFPNIPFEANDYLISERPYVSGQLYNPDIKIIPEIVSYLKTHLQPHRNRTLENFKVEFLRKFEGNLIPLMEAIDPDLGIGYRMASADSASDTLVNELKFLNKSVQNNTRQTFELSPLNTFLLNGMLQKQTIQLEELDKGPNTDYTEVANTISILLSCTAKRIIITQIGGCTANMLLGRFTIASEEITSIGKEIANIEQDANPGVIFFDIAYQFEHHADNINRRKAIYEYELPILNWSEGDLIIDPNDIYVGVMNNEIVLLSKKYGKRLIPKLASAYNYNRSDLSLYRFLSDIQHQGLCSELNLNVKDMLPGLAQYQRIQYKNVILSTEKWAVPDAVCNGYENSRIAALYSWLQKYDINVPFKCGQTDQTLVFDPRNPEDMHFFLLYCKSKRDLYIEETFLFDSQIVADELGKSYVSEFVLSLSHNAQIYKPIPFRSGIKQNLVRKRFLPADEWLYFEIYCQPSGSDQLLQYLERSYLKAHDKRLNKWFFIRYRDPAYHIRLRLKPEFKHDMPFLIEELSKALVTEVEGGIVSDLQIKTYNREIERYGAQRIDSVELFFNLNSQLIMGLIGRAYNNNQLYHFSMEILESSMNALKWDLIRQLAFSELIANSFNTEFQLQTEGLKKINAGYKDFITGIEQFEVNKIIQKQLCANGNSILELVKECEESEKDKMLTDLFHMHVNRLFPDNQRIHEMIIYHYLLRKIKSKIGRSQLLKNTETLTDT